jgi:pectate lyase
MHQRHKNCSIHSFVIAFACASSVFGCGRISGGGSSTEGDAGMESGSNLPAFPGAQGFGATTVGGRGGTVYEVTNLDDSGPGSLRDAVEAKGPRIVVFRVDGTIEEHTPLKIEHPFITIAGQTAPGGGITLSGEEVRVQTHDVVIRHLRIRTGDVVVPVDGWDNRDVINFGAPDNLGGTYNVVIDHCSLSWSVDETLTTWYGSHDITVQNCILSEALYHSFHPKGPHSMGILISDGSYRISIHHDLLADINGRNPQVCDSGVVDIRNNVVYNWGEYAALFKSPDQKINFIANAYQAGPDAGTSFSPSAVKLHDDATPMQLCIEDNIDPVCTSLNDDNWDMVVWTDCLQVTDLSLRRATEFNHPTTATMDVSVAYAYVLKYAGATRPERDAIDTRIVGDVQNGTGGIIDSPADVGGWVTMWQGTPPSDQDHDGMPDDWETAHGLDPRNAADSAKDRNGDGYTNLEEYLNSLAAK